MPRVGLPEHTLPPGWADEEHFSMRGRCLGWGAVGGRGGRGLALRGLHLSLGTSEK